MTDEQNTETEPDEQNGEELPEDEATLGDPDLPAGRLPKGAPTEPGYPPPRD